MWSMSLRPLAFRAPLALAATLAVAPAALAETPPPSPQGYTPDVVVTPQPPVPLGNPVGVPQTPPADAATVQPTDDPDGFQDTDPSALTDFQDQLAPYGQWTQDPTYGTLWVPDAAQVGSDFAPYQTAGQWGVDDGGDWMWQSDYAWGYIPFHYGRWVWAGSYWGWIPGRRYAPAWVSWRVGEGGYVGWAPMPPTYYWAAGRAVGLWTTPYAAYCFVPTNSFFSRGVSAFVVRDRAMVQSIAAGTRAYHPANPTAGAAHHPTFSEAHIPASAVPHGHVSAPPRALAFATRSSTAALRAGYASPQPSGSRSLGSWHTTTGSYYHPSRAQSQGLRTPGQGYTYRGGYQGGYANHAAYPSVHSAPAYHPGFTSGGFHPQAANPSYSTHVYSAPAATHATTHTSTGHAGHSGGRR